jgi:anti-sigma factor (TIGR02949 family)
MTTLNRYTCEETFRRLDDYLDRELSPDEQQLVNEHLQVCAACAREFEFEASLLQSVRGKLRQIALPEALQLKVLELIGAELREGDNGGG